MSKSLTIDPSGLYALVAANVDQQDSKNLGLIKSTRNNLGIEMNASYPLLLEKEIDTVYKKSQMVQKTKLILIEIGTGNVIGCVNHIFDISTSSISLDGRFICLGSKQGHIGIWSFNQDYSENISDLLMQMTLNPKVWSDYPIIQDPKTVAHSNLAMMDNYAPSVSDRNFSEQSANYENKSAPIGYNAHPYSERPREQNRPKNSTLGEAGYRSEHQFKKNKVIKNLNPTYTHIPDTNFEADKKYSINLKNPKKNFEGNRINLEKPLSSTLPNPIKHRPANKIFNKNESYGINFKNMQNIPQDQRFIRKRNAQNDSNVAVNTSTQGQKNNFFKVPNKDYQERTRRPEEHQKREF